MQKTNKFRYAFFLSPKERFTMIPITALKPLEANL